MVDTNKVHMASNLSSQLASLREIPMRSRQPTNKAMKRHTAQISNNMANPNRATNKDMTRVATVDMSRIRDMDTARAGTTSTKACSYNSRLGPNDDSES